MIPSSVLGSSSSGGEGGVGKMKKEEGQTENTKNSSELEGDDTHANVYMYVLVVYMLSCLGSLHKNVA